MNIEGAGLPNITLGWELEATRRASRSIAGIEVGHDGSVGGEAVEYRVKRDLVFDPVKSLAALRSLATDPFLSVDSSCGFHVHLGLANRSRKLHAWAGWFVQLARDLENDAFRAVPESRRQNSFCRSWKPQPVSVLAAQYHPSKGANPSRYNWVNPVEIFRPGGIRTIEVRLMGNTKRYTYLLAWIAVCRMMAQSSWALLFDASRLEAERAEIKKAFSLLHDYFLVGTSFVDAAKAALYLADKAGLQQPFGSPLKTVRSIEEAMSTERTLSEQEHLEYKNLLKAMRDSVKEYRERVISQGLPPAGALLPGDTVECVQVDPDRGTTRGRLYRITSATQQNCTLIGDNGHTWHVPVNCVRLVERDTARVGG